MENVIKDALNCTKVKRKSIADGGKISKAEIYEADDRLIFVKTNKLEQAKGMFNGEYESLKLISSTKTLRVPDPFAVTEIPTGGCSIIMEYFDLHGLNKKSSQLGEQFAGLHLHNIEQEKRTLQKGSFIASNDQKEGDFVNQFGFPVVTYCGYIPQQNEWCNDWITFYGRMLDYQVSRIVKEYGNREISEKWSELERKLPTFFRTVEVKPSLIHGDLWSGNVGECNNSAVAFDPASFYGHHEFDLATASLFHGFSRDFWKTYHEFIPKSDGWEKRNELYKLYHLLNHWNIFGGGYVSSSLDTIKGLLK